MGLGGVGLGLERGADRRAARAGGGRRARGGERGRGEQRSGGEGFARRSATAKRRIRCWPSRTWLGLGLGLGLGVGG